MNDFAKYAVYSWSPYRFSGEAFRDILYYDFQADFPTMTAIVSIASGILLILLLLYMFTKRKEGASESSRDHDSQQLAA